ncbi:aldehyde:ferredoxin oxidoreductase [Desulfofundulus australicus DSM 11792]|uniref:Aldehyde:ferredoxin oxidoreductase n=1 Tax=Desulfofundulus australicus DSM 11792 TaxID=1121425 RepID=A0A1M5AKT0_9FIRM|nr:aldehyde ferredoxin oxidoreductase family protein [Desulfofundulus australicus]SHF30888.1 aldehyde:ferredoxin oxidoreductase [Desulfofundulus australicus DSM 11792]
MLGFVGKIACVNLTDGTVEVRPTPVKEAGKFIGGSGLAARLLYHDLKPEVGPLEEGSPVAIFAGPVTGTAVPSSSRFVVCGRSPLTGFWGESTSGGKFGVVLKRAGFDGLIITGKARELVYLLVENGKVEIKPAFNLKGRDTYGTQEELKKVHGTEASVACIGTAGENLVPIASVINDNGRAAGRMGFGAALGSKNLKAIVAAGRGEIPVASTQALQELARGLNALYKKTTLLTNQFGTLGYLDIGYYFGDVPVKYFTRGIFPIDRMNARRFREEYAVHARACWGCPIGCGRELKFKGRVVDGPEYETAVSFGPLLENFDLDTIVEANHLANCHGFDTISAGVTLGFLMYLKEQNMLPAGLKEEVPAFGDREGILEALKQTAENRGIGRLIGQGVTRTAKELGVSQGYAAAVRGLEIPMHEPRASVGQALSYATGPRGACHQRGDFFQVDLGLLKDGDLHIRGGDRTNLQGRVEAVVNLQCLRELDNCLLKCNFAFTPLKVVVDALKAVTGYPWTPENTLQAAKNSLAVKRMISFNLGSSSADDRLPDHFRKALGEGGAYGIVPDIEKYLPEFYRLQGWNEDGTVPRELVSRLIADDKN